MFHTWRYDAQTTVQIDVPRAYDAARGRSSKIQACKACRRKKTRCDGNGSNACPRCIRNNLPCEYSAAASSSSSASSPPCTYTPSPTHTASDVAAAAVARPRQKGSSSSNRPVRDSSETTRYAGEKSRQHYHHRSNHHRRQHHDYEGGEEGYRHEEKTYPAFDYQTALSDSSSTTMLELEGASPWPMDHQQMEPWQGSSQGAAMGDMSGYYYPAHESWDEFLRNWTYEASLHGGQ